MHRASACSAGAPRWRECREKGPANDEHHEYPARTAMRPVEPGPPKRTVPPDGMRALDGDTHPLAPPCGERRRAGSRPAQRRRTWAHAARTPTPPGAETPAERPSLAEPLPRPQKVSPRLPRRDPPGFRSWTAAGWFSNCRPPAGRSPGTSSLVALRFCQSRSPASTSCNHLSLAGSPSPSGEVRRSAFGLASGWRPKPLADRLDLDAASGPLRPLGRSVSGSIRVTSTPRRTRGFPRGGDPDGWFARPPVRRFRPPSSPSLDATEKGAEP